jgi:sec-independent protein translocase protein TatA
MPLQRTLRIRGVAPAKLGAYYRFGEGLTEASEGIMVKTWMIPRPLPAKDSGGNIVGIPAPTELLLILGIVLLVFGPKKIPEIMGGIGQGIKTFKRSMESDDDATLVKASGPIQDGLPKETKNIEVGDGKKNSV